MRYLLAVIDKSDNFASDSELEAIGQFNDQLRIQEKLIFAVGVGSPANSILIDNRNDAGIKSNTSLLNPDEFMSGFWIIDANNETDASNIALEASKACNRRIELRPLLG